MKAKWKGGLEIVDASGGVATLRIFLLGSEEQCTKQADDVRSFVEALWAMRIDARMLEWKRE